jgi:hypothetical protein
VENDVIVVFLGFKVADFLVLMDGSSEESDAKPRRPPKRTNTRRRAPNSRRAAAPRSSSTERVQNAAMKSGPTRPSFRSTSKNFSSRALKSRPRRQRIWDLPMLVNGTELLARPDTGAGGNFISVDSLALVKLSADFQPSIREDHELGNGKVITSIGTIVVECAFGNDSKTKYSCFFHVLSELVVPLIMGAKFLRETETYTLHKYRLQERAWLADLPLRITYISGAQERISCFLNSRNVLANADTGSELDLMSPDYAAKIDYETKDLESEMDLMSPDYAVKTGHKTKDLESEVEVPFADGSTAVLTGQVFTRFSLYEHGPWSPKWFYILPGLPCDVLLGAESLEDIDAFNPESSMCVSGSQKSSPGLYIIAWLNRGEHLLTGGRSAASPQNAGKRKVSIGSLSHPLFDYNGNHGVVLMLILKR